MSKNKDSQEVPLETSLGNQLGSDGLTLQRAKVDMMRLSILTSVDPFTMPYFLNHPNKYYAKAWANAIENRLNLSVAVEGIARNQIIKVIGASKGIAQKNEAKEPGLIGRLITQRDWKEKAVMQGKEIPEE
jgi:hypothetical protein